MLIKHSPSNGPRVYIAIAEALSFSEKRSETVPPPIAIGAAPEAPAGEVLRVGLA